MDVALLRITFLSGPTTSDILRVYVAKQALTANNGLFAKLAHELENEKALRRARKARIIYKITTSPNPFVSVVYDTTANTYAALPIVNR